MVWSEQTGTSIVVPSDRVQGDGRNYIVIGEDIPPDIAGQFNAAIVFRNAVFDPANEPYGSSAPVGPASGFQYPNGFVYYALGISKSGALELVAFYFVVPSPMGESIATYRQTVFSVSPPVGVDNPPIVALGQTIYGSYNEGTVRVVFGEKASAEVTYATGYTRYIDSIAGWNGLWVWKRSNVVTIGGAVITNAAVGGTSTVTTLSPDLAPPQSLQMASSSNTFIVHPDGRITMAVAQGSGYAASLSVTYAVS